MRIALLSFAVLMLSTALASAADFELPPLNAPANNEHHVGKIVWADLVTPNLGVAERFYGALFGWTFSPIRAGDSDYAVASMGGRPVGGLIEKAVTAEQPRQSAWLTFIAVRDVDAAKRMALAHKGRVLVDARSYPARGRQAVLADPEGAVFAVLASSSGDPADELAEPGEWIWSSLHARDAAHEAAFYQELFSYEVYDADSEPGMDHVILAADNYARAGANSFSSPGRRHAHWLNFVRVANAASAASTAISLGGRVLVEPHDDRQGARVALLADPAGAPFGVMEWADDASAAEAK
jgi:uncharacterized protein